MKHTTTAPHIFKASDWPEYSFKASDWPDYQKILSGVMPDYQNILKELSS